MLKGKIFNINSSKYFVRVNENIYDCTLRGVFRKDKNPAYVGDDVLIDENTLTINEILPRRNILYRPNITNIDIALIVTSVKKPDLDLVLLDKLLVNVISSNIKPLILFTKIDLLTKEEYDNFIKIKDYYSKYYDVCTNTDISSFKKYVDGKIVALTGQTGAGKSTFINHLDEALNLETNPISESLNRGVHTTRYVSIYEIDNFFIADTPGFSFLEIKISKEELKASFAEFNDIECKYRDCDHINTDGCNVIPGDNISQSRYTNYVKFYHEINNNK